MVVTAIEFFAAVAALLSSRLLVIPVLSVLGDNGRLRLVALIWRLSAVIGTGNRYKRCNEQLLICLRLCLDSVDLNSETGVGATVADSSTVISWCSRYFPGCPRTASRSCFTAC
jgi:hypothetical protein